MRIAVEPADEVHSRAAASLASSPLVKVVGLIGKSPPRSWGARALEVSDGSGFDVVVGASASIPNVTPDGAGSISFAGLTGLARCMSLRLEDTTVSMDRTITSSEPGEGPHALFPAPLGAVRRATRAEGVMLCPTTSNFAGVVVSDSRKTIGMVDDVLFASGVCLAAGALLSAHEGPVWERGPQFLQLVESMGLLIAEAVSDAR